MSDTITWVRPSGTEIEIDKDFNAKALRDLGWKKKKATKAKEDDKEEDKDLLSID